MWRYEPETRTIRSVPSNHWVASMNSWDGAENHQANARIIAAAPDLLAALQLVYANAGESPEWIRSRIAPVIARATEGQ